MKKSIILALVGLLSFGVMAGEDCHFDSQDEWITIPETSGLDSEITVRPLQKEVNVKMVSKYVFDNLAAGEKYNVKLSWQMNDKSDGFAGEFTVVANMPTRAEANKDVISFDFVNAEEVIEIISENDFVEITISRNMTEPTKFFTGASQEDIKRFKRCGLNRKYSFGV
jgi:hypothetical protein